MGANPLQKQKRISLLIGLIVGLVIGLILCIILYMFLTSNAGNSITNSGETEYNMITLPTQLSAGDYIDIRLQLPDGGDYIVISKKYVQNANATTVWLNMKEEETLTMSNAIIEYYIMSGSKLYATKYTDPGAQEAAAPTYTPNATVTALIMANENITSQIVDGQGRYTEALKALRNNRIRAAINKHTEDEQIENIETKLQEEIKNLKEARENYFGTLNSLQ